MIHAMAMLANVTDASVHVLWVNYTDPATTRWVTRAESVGGNSSTAVLIRFLIDPQPGTAELLASMSKLTSDELAARFVLNGLVLLPRSLVAMNAVDALVANTPPLPVSQSSPATTPPLTVGPAPPPVLAALAAAAPTRHSRFSGITVVVVAVLSAVSVAILSVVAAVVRRRYTRAKVRVLKEAQASTSTALQAPTISGVRHVSKVIITIFDDLADDTLESLSNVPSRVMSSLRSIRVLSASELRVLSASELAGTGVAPTAAASVSFQSHPLRSGRNSLRQYALERREEHMRHERAQAAARAAHKEPPPPPPPDPAPLVGRHHMRRSGHLLNFIAWSTQGKLSEPTLLNVPPPFALEGEVVPSNRSRAAAVQGVVDESLYGKPGR